MPSGAAAAGLWSPEFAFLDISLQKEIWFFFTLFFVVGILKSFRAQ
jgi:hypothetical protein